MAIKFYFFILFLSGLATEKGFAILFSLHNRCPYTVWPGIISINGGPTLDDGGFTLPSGATIDLKVPPGWSGRLWARTHCDFDDYGNLFCATGDCQTGLRCTANGGLSPVTLVEFDISGGGSNDTYYISLVNGYNIGVGVRPWGGTGDCKCTQCSADMSAICPPELRVLVPSQTLGVGEVVACESNCMAFGLPEYCCTGAPETCLPTTYSAVFKKACPDAYTYMYDDDSSLRTCSGSNYLISFCPDASFS